MNRTFVPLMTYTQEDLELADKHVALGERNLVQQRQIVSGLSERGYPVDDALEVLAALEETLHSLQERRRRIRAEVFPHATPTAIATRRIESRDSRSAEGAC